MDHACCISTVWVDVMKAKFLQLIRNDIFILFMNGMLAHTAFTAAVISTLQVPDQAILDSGLKEIILIFEG